jgi:hypothetical protein
VKKNLLDSAVLGSISGFFDLLLLYSPVTPRGAAASPYFIRACRELL